MEISYKTHIPFQVDNQKITVVGTNSPIVYTDLVNGFQDKNECIEIVDDQYNQIEVGKITDWIGDVGDGTLVAQKYLSKVEKLYSDSLVDENRNKIHDQMNELFNTVSEQLFMLDLPISIDYDFEIKRLLKFCNIRFDPVLTNNPYGIIESVLKIHEECDIKSCVVLTNVAHYLTPSQYLDLIELVKQTNQSLVLIEFTEIGCQEFYKNSEFYYIDADFVDWHL